MATVVTPFVPLPYYGWSHCPIQPRRSLPSSPILDYQRQGQALIGDPVSLLFFSFVQTRDDTLRQAQGRRRSSHTKLWFTRVGAGFCAHPSVLVRTGNFQKIQHAVFLLAVSLYTIEAFFTHGVYGAP